MTGGKGAGGFDDEYLRCLAEHLDAGGQDAENARQLGRRALAADLTVLDLLAAHRRARRELLGHLDRLDFADAFLGETMAAHEIAQRANADAHRLAVHAQQRVDLLRGLSDAYLAIAGAPTLDERLQQVCVQAQEFLGAEDARLEFGRHGPVEGDEAEGLDEMVAQLNGSGGRLILRAQRGRAWSAVERQTLQQLALLISAPIDDARRLDFTQRLERLGALFASASDQKTILDRLLQEGVAGIDADDAALWLVDGDTTQHVTSGDSKPNGSSCSPRLARRARRSSSTPAPPSPTISAAATSTASPTAPRRWCRSVRAKVASAPSGSGTTRPNRSTPSSARSSSAWPPVSAPSSTRAGVRGRAPRPPRRRAGVAAVPGPPGAGQRAVPCRHQAPGRPGAVAPGHALVRRPRRRRCHGGWRATLRGARRERHGRRRPRSDRGVGRRDPAPAAGPRHDSRRGGPVRRPPGTPRGQRRPFPRRLSDHRRPAVDRRDGPRLGRTVRRQRAQRAAPRPGRHGRAGACPPSATTSSTTSPTPCSAASSPCRTSTCPVCAGRPTTSPAPRASWVATGMTCTRSMITAS